MTRRTLCLWKPELAADYKKSFDVESICDLHDRLDRVNLINLEQYQLDDIMNDVCNLFINPAKTLGISKPQKSKTKAKKPKTTSNKPWFSNVCKNKRVEYNRKKNRLKVSKTDEARTELKDEAKQYKKLLKNQRKLYYKELHHKLRELKQNNGKEYWNILNKCTNKKEIDGNISLKAYMNHFKTLGENVKPEHAQTKFDPSLIYSITL